MRTQLFALLLITLLPGWAAAQDLADQRRTITVAAVAGVDREPELARVLLAVESEAPTAQEAARRNAALMERVLAAVRQAGIPALAIRTVSYELRPEYSRPDRTDPGTPRIIGYRAINMVQVHVDPLDRTGAVIDAALNAGANRVTSLMFELRDPDAARLDALRAAMTRAQREAEAVATAAGQRLGSPLRIDLGGAMAPPMPMARAEMAMDAATPIEGGQLTIMATVHVVYEILSP
jgi:uncharacterized protein